MTKPERTYASRGRSVGAWTASLTSLVLVLAGCAGGTSTGPGWTSGPAIAAPSTPPGASDAAPSAPVASATPSVASAPSPSQSAEGATPKPFSGRMTPQVLLVDGYVSMYMDLENTGAEPLTFINTLYDIEPTKLYNPTVAYPWADGGTAVVTRNGRFFPSPAIVQPGQRAVYFMGGERANGTGQLTAPVANIKFCPTRGMDDRPSVPITVEDVSWSTSNGVTTVKGMLIETEGARRADPPVVGVAFFASDGAFVGAVVDSRLGDRIGPNARVPFTMEGHGVDADRIDHFEAYAFVS